MFAKEYWPLLTGRLSYIRVPAGTCTSMYVAGWAEIESLAGKWSKIFVLTFGINTLNSRYAFTVISAWNKAVWKKLNPLKPSRCVFCIILFAVLFRKGMKMLLKYDFEIIWTTLYIFCLLAGANALLWKRQVEIPLHKGFGGMGAGLFFIIRQIE